MVRLVFGDSADLGSDGKTPKRKYRQDKSQTSIDALGRRYMELAEEGTPINTVAEADAMVAAALSDLATPPIEFGIDAYFYPWVQLNDFYLFTANDVHFDSDQSLAIVSYRHTITMDADGRQVFSTDMGTRGKPTCGSLRWHELDARPGNARTHGLFNPAGGATMATITTEAAKVVGGATLRVAEKLNRSVKWEGVEVHVSRIPGFTPDSTTLHQMSKADTIEVQGLVPGLTYYSKAIPRYANAGKPIIGQPTEEVSFVAAFAEAKHHMPYLDFRSYPLNGGFESPGEIGTPPDIWTTAVGTFGVDWELSSSSRTLTGSTAADFLATAVATKIVAGLVPINGARPYMVRWHPKAGTPPGAGRQCKLKAEWLDYARASISTTTTTVELGTVDHGYYHGQKTTLLSPVNAAWVRLSIEKTAHADAVFSIDNVRITELGDSWHEVDGDATEPNFTGTWVNYGSVGMAFLRDDLGFVHIRGEVKDGTAGTSVFTLPAGYRPAANSRFPITYSGGVGFVSVNSDGTVVPEAAAGSLFVSMNGITFYPYV